jgi:hypothetical protein
MDLEQYRYDSSTSKRTPIKYSSRIEENKEENLLQKMHISERTSQYDREIIGYSNPVLPSLSLSQTIIKFPEFNNQSMGLGHILPMGIQNNWRNQMVAKNH